jgi:23S rRNA (uridine2552-2'-O)-methyltransferase
VSQSSKAWINRHVNDGFVQKAKREGYRSRAAYKLQEIAERDRIFRHGMVVVDLGAAPGGWSQFAAQQVGSAGASKNKGAVIAIDLLPVDEIGGVDFIQNDFTTDEGLAQVQTLVNGRPVDVVLSDMAPNISGIKLADQARHFDLCELALDFAVKQLKPDGCFVVKVFHGPGFDDYVKLMRQHFVMVANRKPKASRGESAECFFFCRGLKNAKVSAESAGQQESE